MRRIIPLALVLAVTASPAWAQKKKEDPVVAQVKEKLKTKVTVEYKETPLKEVVEDLKKQIENLSIYVDNPGGVSNNQSMTFTATDMPLDEVLDQMFKKATMGYVIGKKGGRYSARYIGWLIITKTSERGDEAGSSVVAKPPKESKDPKDPKEEKPEVTDKPPKVEKPPVPPEDDAEKAEKDAATKLRLAKDLLEDGRVEKAKERLEGIVKDYPKTKAAVEAQQVLEKIDK